MRRFGPFEASLLRRALSDAGFEDVANSIALVAGAWGRPMVWWAYHFEIPRCRFNYGIGCDHDQRPNDTGKIPGFGWVYGITTYGATSSVAELAAAAAIDTKATALDGILLNT